MLQSFRDYIQIAAFQRQIRDLDREYEVKFKEARLSGQETVHISREHFGERDFISHQIHRIQTQALIRRAEQLFIEVPDYNDNELWADSHIFGGRFLTRKGILQLRSSVRKERKEQWDFLAGRLAAGTGLIGTLIGLISILKK